MLFALSLLLPLLLISLWLFFRFSPKRDNGRPVIWFNAVALALCVAICAWVVLAVRATMIGSNDQSWWALMALFYTLVTLPACLAVAAGLRHLIFRSKEKSKPLEVRDLSQTRF